MENIIFFSITNGIYDTVCPSIYWMGTSHQEKIDFSHATKMHNDQYMNVLLKSWLVVLPALFY